MFRYRWTPPGGRKVRLERAACGWGAERFAPAGLVFASRLTRLVAAAASAVDFLHLAYDVAKRAATR